MWIQNFIWILECLKSQKLQPICIPRRALFSGFLKIETQKDGICMPFLGPESKFSRDVCCMTWDVTATVYLSTYSVHYIDTEGLSMMIVGGGGGEILYICSTGPTK